MGTAAAAKLVFGIPEGDVGPMPNIGVGKVTNVNLDPGNIVGDATVNITPGIDPSFSIDFGIPVGKTGPMPDIPVGDVSNVSLNTGNIIGNATVTLTESTNSTDPSYTFNFGIPEGRTGPMPDIPVGDVSNVNLNTGNVVGDATVTLTKATNSTDPSYTFHFGIPIGKLVLNQHLDLTLMLVMLVLNLEILLEMQRFLLLLVLTHLIVLHLEYQ